MPKSRRERELEELLRLRSQSPARPTVDWETASRCPRCNEPMATVHSFRPALNLSATLYVLECRNANRCPWGEVRGRKIVEVMADGTIPVMLPGPKTYNAEHLSPEQQSKIDEFFNQQYRQTLDKKEVWRN